MLITELHNQTCFLGEGIGYSKCVYLIYDGIHYDPLAVQSSDRTKEPLQTVFPVGDDMRLAEALEIAAGAKQVRIKKVFTTSKSLLALGTLGALARIREWIYLLQLSAPFTHSLSFNHF